MDKLRVPALVDMAKDNALQEISGELDKLERHVIRQAPWKAFPYKPDVSFAIAYTGDTILLKYFVEEKSIRVGHHTDNSAVHEDSCVELFIAFDDDEAYYNLEFNCAGTCLLGYGKNRQDRQLIDSRHIRKIRREAVIKSLADSNDQLVTWELTMAIPPGVFVYHPISSLKNRQCRVNFYKCGDKLPEPHFLAWKGIAAAVPDFHLPEFFGHLQFV